MSTPSTPSERYLALLPEIFREPPAAGQEPPFVARLLELIASLLGGFEAKLGTISDYFDPAKTAPDTPSSENLAWLSWMASWFALVLRTDWTEAQQRTVLSQILPLYRKRGTVGGLEEYLGIYVGPGVSIHDYQAFQVGVTSIVEGHALIGGLPPYFFIVNVAFDTADVGALAAKVRAVEAVLDIEKPAHTFYELRFTGRTFQIGMQSTIGKDTLL